MIKFPSWKLRELKRVSVHYDYEYAALSNISPVNISVPQALGVSGSSPSPWFAPRVASERKSISLLRALLVFHQPEVICPKSTYFIYVFYHKYLTHIFTEAALISSHLSFLTRWRTLSSRRISQNVWCFPLLSYIHRFSTQIISSVQRKSRPTGENTERPQMTNIKRWKE